MLLHGWTKWGRFAELIVGAVFIAGAVLKARGVNTFAVQIYAYGVIENKALLPCAALGTLFIEMAIGMALLLRLRLRHVTHAALQGVLIVFTLLIIYGWVFFDIEDCGCFGPLEMSPGISIAKNIALMLLGGMGWFAAWKHPRLDGLSVKCCKSFLCALGAVAIVAYAFYLLDRDVPLNSGQDTALFSQFIAETEEGVFDLGSGEYLVVVLSLTCEECIREVPVLNQLLVHPDLPPMVALCLEEEEGGLERFRLETNPEFPLHSLGNRPLLYFSLIGQDTFRMYYVRDGRPLRFWDGHPPEITELLQIVRQDNDG